MGGQLGQQVVLVATDEAVGAGRVGRGVGDVGAW